MLFFCINRFYFIITGIKKLAFADRIIKNNEKNLPQKNREISNSDILYIRKLVRIRSNARIPGYSHCEDKGYCSYFSKKIEMVKIAIPNFCINFLNKTVKSLSILCDFAVASFGGAWIKMRNPMFLVWMKIVASFGGAWIKMCHVDTVAPLGLNI